MAVLSSVLPFRTDSNSATLSEVRVVRIKFGLHRTRNPTLRTHLSAFQSPSLLWNRTPACPEGESQLVFSKSGLRFVRLEAFTGRTGTVFTLRNIDYKIKYKFLFRMEQVSPAPSSCEQLGNAVGPSAGWVRQGPSKHAGQWFPWLLTAQMHKCKRTPAPSTLGHSASTQL